MMTEHELQKLAVNVMRNSDISASGDITLEQFSSFAALENFSLFLVLCRKNRLPLDSRGLLQSQRKLVLSSSLQRKLYIVAIEWFDRQNNGWSPPRTSRAARIPQNQLTCHIVIYQALKLMSCSEVAVQWFLLSTQHNERSTLPY